VPSLGTWRLMDVSERPIIHPSPCVNAPSFSMAKGQVQQAGGQCDLLHALVEMIAKGQVQQAGGQCDLLHALIETLAKGQALQAGGQRDLLHALREIITKGQALQAGGQRDLLHAPIEEHTKAEALQAGGQRDLLNALVEIVAKSQALQANGQRDRLHVQNKAITSDVQVSQRLENQQVPLRHSVRVAVGILFDNVLHLLRSGLLKEHRDAIAIDKAYLFKRLGRIDARAFYDDIPHAKRV